MAEKGYEFAEVTSTVEPLPAGPKLVKVVFDVKEGPKVKVRTINFDGNVEVSDGTLGTPDEGHQGARLAVVDHRQGHLPGSQVRGRRRKDRSSTTATRATSPRASASPRSRCSKTATTRKRAGSQLNIPIDEGPRYRVGEFKFDGNKVIKTEFLRAALQAEEGRLVLRQADPQRPDQGARGATAAAATSSSPASRISSPSTRPKGPLAGPAEPTVNVTMRMQEGEQYFVNRLTFAGNTTTRDNVIRREVRLVEGGAVQHRSAEVQRQAPQPARLLQAARRRPGRRRPEDAEREEPGRRHAEARRAEPQPADVRRRRVAVRRLLRPAVVPDLELPRPRRSRSPCRCRSARARRTTRSRSPSRSCSIATSPAASTSTSARCATSTSSRRRPPAATSRSASRWPASRACSCTYSYEAVDGVGPEPDLLRARAGAAQSVPARFAAARRRRPAHRSARSRRASSTTPSTTRSSRTPASASPARSTSPASAATPTSSSRASNTRSFKPLNRRMSVGFRAQVEYIRPYASARPYLPITETLYLGGEYTIRGFDIRSIGPRDPRNRPRARRQQDAAVQRRIPDQHRRPGAPGAVLRHRPGAQHRRELRAGRKTSPCRSIPALPPIIDPFSTTRLIDPNAPPPYQQNDRRDQRVQDLDRRRGPVLHAGAERAVPVDLRV